MWSWGRSVQQGNHHDLSPGQLREPPNLFPASILIPVHSTCSLSDPLLSQLSSATPLPSTPRGPYGHFQVMVHTSLHTDSSYPLPSSSLPSWVVLKCSRQAPTSGPLHVLSPLLTKPRVLYFASSGMLLKSHLLCEASQGHRV